MKILYYLLLLGLFNIFKNEEAKINKDSIETVKSDNKTSLNLINEKDENNKIIHIENETSDNIAPSRNLQLQLINRNDINSEPEDNPSFRKFFKKQTRKLKKENYDDDDDRKLFKKPKLKNPMGGLTKGLKDKKNALTKGLKDKKNALKKGLQKNNECKPKRKRFGKNLKIKKRFGKRKSKKNSRKRLEEKLNDKKSGADLDTCDLSMELYPYFYIPVIRASFFRIGFSSSCFRKRDYQFKVFYNESKFVNWNHHPTTLKLNLFGGHYEIKYSKPKMIDEFDIIKSLMYETAEFEGSMNPVREIDISDQNQIFLDPQIENIFNPFNINKLKSIKGSILCTTEIRRFKHWKKIKEEREKYGRKLSQKQKNKMRKLLELDLKREDLIRREKKEKEREKMFNLMKEFMDENYLKEINIICDIK
jgi:hypothetical protein